MSYKDLPEELAREAMSQILFEGSICAGPSREELFDGLKYFMFDEFRVDFTFSHPDSKEVAIFSGRVLGIDCEDGSMQSWVVKAQFDEINPGFTADTWSVTLLPETFSLYYDSHRRIGRVVSSLSGRLTISGGMVWRGNERLTIHPNL